MIRVGVFMGGLSIEREVSFNSGRTICDHLDAQLFTVVPIFQTQEGLLYILPWTFLYRGKIADFYDRLEEQAQKISWDELKNHIDFVYIAVHGRYGEDGCLQAMLEMLKIPYLGSKVFASGLGMNKRMHNLHLKARGIAVPQGFALSVDQIKNYDENQIENFMHQANISFPCIVKPNNEGSSFGVFVVNELKELQNAVEKSCFMLSSHGQQVLVEEKIKGMEFTCIVITDNKTGRLIALPPTEILVPDEQAIFNYEQKYMPGAGHERTPARCSADAIEKIQSTAIATMQALGFTNLARIDGFLTQEGNVVVIDSNPLSGMAPASFLFRQAAEINMSHTQLINHLIKTDLKWYGMDIQEKEEQKILQKRLRVGVLFGGPSNEREISLESGRNVVYKLSPEKYEAIPLFMSQDQKMYILDQRLLVGYSTAEIMQMLTVSNQLESRLVGWSDLPKLVDFMFIALHGSPGEDGKVQGALEMLGIAYNGSGVLTSALCMDKFKTTQFLHEQGFDTPKSLLLSYDQWIAQDEKLDHFLQEIGYPCIVKPHDDGCSVMVASPKNKQELQAALQEIFIEKKFALVEERIAGMELTVGVLGNDNPKALMPSQTVVKGDLLSLEEKFLPGAGENQTPALLPADDITFVRKKIVEVYTAIGCRGYARIDCFFQTAEQSFTGKRRLVILEINSLPGLTPATCIFHQAAEDGIAPMEFIDKIIQLGLQEHVKDTIVSVDQALEVQQNWNQ
ncbi:MAG: D-alanine--D-alanine ligase family protein [Candidatus Chromulinivorax sp.]